jgi:hypothetical protein
MSNTDLIARLQYCWRCMGPVNPHRETIKEAAAVIAAQAQENERLAAQRDSALMKLEAIAELEHKAHLQRGDAIDREELTYQDRELLLEENAELRQRAEETAAAIAAQDEIITKHLRVLADHTATLAQETERLQKIDLMRGELKGVV